MKDLNSLERARARRVQKPPALLMLPPEKQNNPKPAKGVFLGPEHVLTSRMRTDRRYLGSDTLQGTLMALLESRSRSKRSR